VLTPAGQEPLRGEARRIAVAAELGRLPLSLSRQGWLNYQAFVNGPLRQATVVIAVSHPAVN